MRIKNIETAKKEAQRFINRANELLKLHEECTNKYGVSAPKQSGALRRASMDLTRSLAEMRKP